MANCTVCGEPMPPGEEMFKFHGYSGDCPKPPLPKPEKIDIRELLRHSPSGYTLEDAGAAKDPSTVCINFDTPENAQKFLDWIADAAMKS